ncbi:transposase [Hymenobacter sp. B81]|uniref:transposase n=1 Tax=Hymenobacter sp. B81 TaxID=3344878 RepID=UPI0037DCBAFE
MWTRTGQPRPLPTVSGRERVNLNAALNAHCPTQVHLHETDCVNAQSTKALYEQLLSAHPGEQPIYVVCDNARYYRNRELAEWLQGRRVVQVFLPPYVPNLNLISACGGCCGRRSSTPVYTAPRARFGRRYSVSFPGSTSLGKTSRPY